MTLEIQDKIKSFENTLNFLKLPIKYISQIDEVSEGTTNQLK